MPLSAQLWVLGQTSLESRPLGSVQFSIQRPHQQVFPHIHPFVHLSSSASASARRAA